MHKSIVLPNGLTIVYEKMQYVRSVAVGVWVMSGSRFDSVGGTSHFIEHMLFKGTKTRTAQDIAEAMDEVGGQLSAYTTREYTCYYSYTVDKHLSLSLELLGDMLTNPLLDSGDIETEKGVILEEIAMYEDAPEELAFDKLALHAWRRDAIGANIAGTKESVMSIDREKLISHMEKFYVPQNMVISVAGNFSEEELLTLVDRHFKDIYKRSGARPQVSVPQFFKGEFTTKKEIEQASLLIGYEGLSYNSPDRYAQAVLNNILGASASSRLFQTVREKEGLAYSVYTSTESYINTGLFVIYAGLNPARLDKCRNLLDKEITLLLKDGITDKELVRGREQLKGNFILGYDSVSARMSAHAKAMLLKGKCTPPEEQIEKIDAITKEDVMRVAKNIFSSHPVTEIITKK